MGWPDSGALRKFRPAPGLLALAAAGAAVALLTAVLYGSPAMSVAFLETMAVFFLLALPVFLRALRSDEAPDYLSVFNMFLLASFFFYVVKPLFIIFYLDFKMAGLLHLPQEKAMSLLGAALFYVLCGILSFYAGYLSGAGRIIAEKLPVFGKNWRPLRLKALILVFIVIGVAAYFYLMGSGITGPRSQLVKGENKYIFLGILFLKTSLVLLFAGALVFRDRLMKTWFWLLLPFYVWFMVSLGGRGRFLMPLLMCLVFYNYFQKRISFKRLLLFVVAAFLVVSFFFGVANQWIAGKALGVPDVTGPSLLVKFAIERNIDRIDNLAVLLNGMGRLDFQFGKTFLAPFLKFVPDAVRQSIGMGIEDGGKIFMKTFFPLVLERGYGFPITFIGELYLNLHLPGIVLGMFLFGIWASAAQGYLDRDRKNPAGVLFYGFAFVSVSSFLGGNFAHFFVFASIDFFLYALALCLTAGIPRRAIIPGENQGT